MRKSIPSSKPHCDKHLLRTKKHGELETLPQSYIDKSDAAIEAKLLSLPEYLSAKRVFVYFSVGREVKTQGIISHALAAGKTICVPHMRETRGLMDAAIIANLEDLVVGQFNLLTPNPATLNLLEPSELDLIIVPGVAFDKTGRRLGMGAGYYDRFLLRANKAELIGAAWAAQILETVPTDEHDKPVNYLLTEEGIFPCR